MRKLRDCSNPLELPQTAFIAYYRLNKDAFRMVLEATQQHLSKSKISPAIQLAAALRFLAEGSYQKSVGNDSSISLDRSTVSMILNDVLKVLERFICPQWVQLEINPNENQKSRDYFYSKYKIPSIIGCIDGTHVKMIKPRFNEHLFFNRKGYFSMNAMIMYANSAVYPSAQVAAEEIFDSGLIPYDTDYRIFRNFGGLPGLDFAHIINGQRYHTKFDSTEYLPSSSIQHTGSNILELTKALADSYEFGNIIADFDGSSVYYDVFGIYFVKYSKDFATMFNYVIVISSVLLPYIILSRATKGINKKYLRYEIFLGFLIKMISLVTSCGCCYAIAYDLDTMGKPMTWYSNAMICAPTYCLVTVFVQSAIHLIFNRNQKTPLSLALQTQARLIGSSFFWGILCAALTGAGIRTAYALVIPLLINFIINIIIGLLKLENTIRRWLYVHLIGQILVALWTLNLYNMVLDVFISTSGRSGGNKNPDVMIALICSTFTFLTTSYLTPLVILFKRCKNFLIILFATYVVTRFYFIAFTQSGFPYRDDKHGNPKVQRHFITHTIRTLYDKEGNIRYTDSGFWFLEMDRNARKTIESLTMPEEPVPQDENILCKSEVFCGLPLLSVRQLMTGGFWVNGPAPVLRESGHLKLSLHEKLSATQHRMHFMITGSYLMSLKIRTKESVTLESWNLTPQLPPETVYNHQKCYFVMITHGLENEAINITLILKTADKDFKRSLIDLTLVTTHFEQHKEHTSIFAKMLAKLPSWAYAVPSLASLKSWTF